MDKLTLIFTALLGGGAFIFGLHFVLWCSDKVMLYFQSPLIERRFKKLDIYKDGQNIRHSNLRVIDRDIYMNHNEHVVGKFICLDSLNRLNEVFVTTDDINVKFISKKSLLDSQRLDADKYREYLRFFDTNPINE